MRNFRKAALAGATAVAVATGSMSVAVAQDAPKAEGNLATQIGLSSQAWRPKTADDKAKEAGTTEVKQNKAEDRDGKKGETQLRQNSNNTVSTGVDWANFTGPWDFETPVEDGGTPLWVPILFAGGIAAMVSAVVGLIVGPLYNFIVHGM